MTPEQKRSVFIYLGLGLLLLPPFYERSQDCYSTRRECELDWSSSDCNDNVDHATANQCHYLGRTHSIYFGQTFDRRQHSDVRVIRGGFGHVGGSLHVGG